MKRTIVGIATAAAVVALGTPGIASNEFRRRLKIAARLAGVPYSTLKIGYRTKYLPVEHMPDQKRDPRGLRIPQTVITVPRERLFQLAQSLSDGKAHLSAGNWNESTASQESELRAQFGALVAKDYAAAVSGSRFLLFPDLKAVVIKLFDGRERHIVLRPDR